MHSGVLVPRTHLPHVLRNATLNGTHAATLPVPDAMLCVTASVPLQPARARSPGAHLPLRGFSHGFSASFLPELSAPRFVTTKPRCFSSEVREEKQAVFQR